MKKIIVVLIVALVVLSSASAFKFKSVGIDVGSGYYATVDMEIIDNLDIYAGIGYAGSFAITSGIQFNVATFKLGETPVAVRPGAQMNIYIGSGKPVYSIIGTCAFSFETKSLTAFLRPGLGVALTTYRDPSDKLVISTDFAFTIDAGVAYLF